MDLFKLFGTIAINTSDANKALKDTTQAAKETGDSLNDTADSGESSGGKLSGALSKIGSGAAKLGKAVVTGVGVAAAGVSALATSAINSYADYEQLVGGVDTLFKDASGKVQEYAKNAFQTAGLSANEYMETVTSFSASLLQSLDGDTTAAAEKANMAITDMSDNANKMGTDMAAIQNAYNGFAKQNYTMLDNLKLGYGGTQEEMARLLSDAQAISGIKYDISSYADVVDAIHVIQTEMGITGTTAKEASSTISGSIASMKGSWQNLLTAISSDDLPFDDYVNSFVESVSTVVGNLMPRISTALNGVVKLIDGLAPVIIGKIPELFNQLLPSVINAAVDLLNSFVAAFPGIISALMNILPALIDGVTQIVNSLIAALPSIVQALVSAFPTLIPALVSGLVLMIVTLCTQLPQIIQPIIDYLPEIIISIVNALVQNLPVLIEGLITLVVGIVQAIPQIIEGLVNAIPTIVALIVAALLENIPALINAAITMVMAVVDALPTIIMALVNALPGILKSVWDAIVNVFKSLPQWFGQLWNGVKDVTSNLWNAIKTVISTVAGGIWDKIKSVWNGVKGTISSVTDGIKTKISSAWNGIKSTTTTVWNGVKTAITTPIEKARDTIKGIVDKIKGFFSGMKISFPKIKLPHFSVKPSGWSIGDLLKGSIPSLGIEWYAKAMNNPIVMTKPTVFGYNAETGKLQGGGDAGSEVVSGTNTLMGMIRAAVASQNDGVVYYLQKLIDILAVYFPQVLEMMNNPVPAVVDANSAAAALAVPMNRELGKLSGRKERGR